MVIMPASNYTGSKKSAPTPRATRKAAASKQRAKGAKAAKKK